MTIDDMPIHQLKRGGKAKREIDLQGLVTILGRQRLGHAFVETQGGLPGQNVSGVGSMMKGYGIILGILGTLGTPVTLVSPVKWKKALAVPAAKDGARARASQLLPECAGMWPLVKDHGKAEAALIALYGFRSFQGIEEGMRI